MVRHQVLIKFESSRYFAGNRDLTGVEPEWDGLTWYLLPVDAGWVLMSGNYGFHDQITRHEVNARLVEEFLFFVVKQRSVGEPVNVGLSPEYVSWRIVKKLPAKIAKRYGRLQGV